MAESIFRHNDQIYVQRIILPIDSSTFTLKFRLYAELGLEVFLKFNTREHSQSDNWFYTFNSADIMSRHPFPDQHDLIGDNYFPINGGLFIENLNTFLHIYPDFPLGAGMPDSSSFQLHLHRNPYADDDLGLDVYYGEYSSAEHSLLFGFTELKPSKIWEIYLENKASPQVFFIGTGTTLTLDLQTAEKNEGKWEFETEYSLINEDKCAYLSSLNIVNNETIARILNVCDKTISPEFDQFVLLDERNTLGGKIEDRKSAKESGILEFTINQNSGKNFVQYPKCENEGLIKPFHLNTYTIDQVL